MPNHFVFSPDGRYVYGSAYYTGVSNIFRYEIATAKVEAVTNTDTGFFRPLPLDDGSLIAFRYSGQGFVPTRLQVTPVEDIAPITFLGERLAEEHPVVRDWALGSPMQVDLTQRPTETTTYSPFRRMRAGLAVPDRPVVQEHRRAWHTRLHLGPATGQPRQPRGRLLTRHEPARRGAPAPAGRLRARRLARRLRAQRR